MTPVELDLHVYLSTACVHGLCGKCRLTCKYCITPCICTCHAQETPAP